MSIAKEIIVTAWGRKVVQVQFQAWKDLRGVLRFSLSRSTFRQRAEQLSNVIALLLSVLKDVCNVIVY